VFLSWKRSLVDNFYFFPCNGCAGTFEDQTTDLTTSLPGDAEKRNYHVVAWCGGTLRIGVFNMPTGTVKWFNTTKGFGFIAPDDGGKDVFVHISAVERSGMTGLADNQKVSFELREGRDGRQMASDLAAV